jgi:hypothetical protein
MAILIELMDDTVSLFYKIVDESAIPNWVEIKVFCDNNQKKVYKVQKTNDVTEKLSDGVNVTIIFNEDILTQLPTDMQLMCIKEALHGIVVDENDKLKVEKPDVETHSGILHHFGQDAVIQMKESIRSLYDKKKQRDEEEKARSCEEKKLNKKRRGGTVE